MFYILLYSVEDFVQVRTRLIEIECANFLKVVDLG